MTESEGIVDYARRINRTWIVRGDLSQNASLFLQHLESTRPESLKAACALAVEAAKHASRLGKDPKPAFYSGLFSQATKEERGKFLKNHQWTRRLAATFERAPQLPEPPLSE
jgi:hypothetical protein